MNFISLNKAIKLFKIYESIYHTTLNLPYIYNNYIFVFTTLTIKMLLPLSTIHNEATARYYLFGKSKNT